MDSFNSVDGIVDVLVKIVNFFRNFSTMDLPIFKEIYQTILDFIREYFEKEG